MYDLLSVRYERRKDMREKEEKRLAEMNLLDDFLFGSVVTYPEIGEKFVGSLLKTIFGREVRYLSVTAQKVLFGADSDLHGARLDVYLEPDIEEGIEGSVTVYDIEPDKNDSPSDKKMLPRRVRFYHGKIAARSLNSGVDYGDLKNVVILMIMPYDPFGFDRMMYTMKSKCVEVPEMEYEDGASTVFLYTKGTVGVPSEEVRQLLHYMEETTYENAVNGDLLEIHRMVETVKRDPEVSRMRIKIVEDNIKLRQEVTRQADKIAGQERDLAKREGEITRQADKIAGQEDKITKLERELKELREELKIRDGRNSGRDIRENSD